MIDWLQYRVCPVCKVKMGEACVSLSGKVIHGRPDRVRTELDAAHTIRKLRTGRRRPTVA